MREIARGGIGFWFHPGAQVEKMQKVRNQFSVGATKDTSPHAPVKKNIERRIFFRISLLRADKMFTVLAQFAT